MLFALNGHKNKKELLHVIFFFLSFMVAIRYNVGNDYVNYKRIFEDEVTIDVLYFLTEVEVGSFGSMALFKFLGFGVPVWFFFISMMTFECLFKGIERFGLCNVWWSVLIYYSFFFLMNNCNLMQHGAMCGWIWLAFSYIKDCNLKKYLTFAIVGASFHILGLLIIPFYWFLKKDTSLKFCLIVLGGAYSFGLFLQDIVFQALNFGYFGGKIEYYQEIYFQGEEISRSISVGMIIYSLLLILLYRLPLSLPDQENLKIARNALLLSIVFQVVFKGTGIFDARLGGVFNISLIMLIPYYLNYISFRTNRVLGVSILLAYAFIIFITTSLTPSNQYDSEYQFIPYKTIFK